ncbi:M18 family aminopeptidase [Corynebacterium yudongzhengii]|uniref:M18 family aminopeptidase n=1 Tax=Corynebacterium yudongzhengii TaxID=2080740 RepID=A0A2U1T8F7_9CORY|nr:M18 family aminopeptidase [Corynebacterium yudongzhengii]AWB81899.1 M18 family aminopeptidase [Corynebacterium yudongzhengii]PWC02291.1 M18 family aminopeptidase [Corynebacterium yudongzhengii]
MNSIRDLLDFIQDSPSAYHAAHAVAERLGYPVHNETDDWPATAGGHTVIRGGAVISYYIPENPRSFRIIGSHTDSPALYLKPQPDFTAHGFDQVAVEIYGGPILETMFDRELTVAGRVVLVDGTEHLVRLDSALRLPNLAIHLGREEIKRQEHIVPVSLSGPVMEQIAEQLGVTPRDIVGHDLLTVDAQPGEVCGEYLLAPRLDNLSSVHASLTALQRAEADARDVLVLAAFNHEEVGSSSPEGAAGSLFEDVLWRTAEALGRDPRQMLAGATQVSADAAHSVHPNYPHKHDPQHRPVIGGGPVTKINAKQRYASDAATIAMWERACIDMPNQHFVSNNNVPCGSTIGPISATRLGIPTVDVGVPLLSMHSAREMIGTRDQLWLTDALEAYLID